MAKRVKISRKDLLKETDQFLSTSEKAMLYYMDNRAIVIGVVASIFIAGSSFLGFKYFKETQALKNEELYFEMVKIVDKGSTSEANAVLSKIGDGLQKQRAKLLLGDSHFQNKEYGKAEALYSEVLGTSSSGHINHQLAQVALAHSYQAQKDYKKAIALFKTVIDANTSFPLFEVYWNLAKCHELNNDVSNALLVLREMRMKFSENPQVDKIEGRIQQLSA